MALTTFIGRRTWRQRILSGVLDWERKFPHADGYLAVHLAEFYDANDPKCIHAVKQLIDQKLLLSVNRNLMVGVRSNPEELADIMKELQEREWYTDPRFLIPSAIALAALLSKFWH